MCHLTTIRHFYKVAKSSSKTSLAASRCRQCHSVSCVLICFGLHPPICLVSHWSELTYTRPHIFSRIDWQDPRHDPIFRQFIPLKSLMQPNHPKSQLDSLHEKDDAPLDNLVHRYPDKALFLREYIPNPLQQLVCFIGIFLLITTSNGSDSCLPHVLSILHAIICCWSGHQRGDEAADETDPEEMGGGVQVYRRNPADHRHCCVRG